MMKKLTFFLGFLLIVLNFSCNSEATEIENIEEEVTKDCNITSKDGLLILEAENFELKGSWRIVEDEKASEGKYITYFGANSYQTQNLAHEISIKFKIPEKSSYLVRWYMRQADDAEGDKSNDVWIKFPDNMGRARRNGESVVLEHYEKFVSRGKGEFTYGGALDLHNPKASSWMRVEFPEAGVYTLYICARSKDFQLDKMVLSSGISDIDAQANSKNSTETIICN